MSRTVQSDAIQEGFLDALRAEGAVVESMSEFAARFDNRKIVDVLEALGIAGRNVFLVKGVGLINVHVRSDGEWWNILRSIKDDLDGLQEFGFNRYFVLLTGRKDQYIADGYIISDFNASPLLRHPRDTEATKFTLNEKQDLDRDARFSSVSKIAKVLLGLRKVREAT